MLLSGTREEHRKLVTKICVAFGRLCREIQVKIRLSKSFLVSRTPFEGLGLVLDSTAFLVSLVSVSLVSNITRMPEQKRSVYMAIKEVNEEESTCFLLVVLCECGLVLCILNVYN